jgi:hypothetical protein
VLAVVCPEISLKTDRKACYRLKHILRKPHGRQNRPELLQHLLTGQIAPPLPLGVQRPALLARILPGAAFLNLAQKLSGSSPASLTAFSAFSTWGSGNPDFFDYSIAPPVRQIKTIEPIRKYAL